MLRNLVLGFAALVTLVGVVITLRVGPGGLGCLLFGGLLLIGSVFERVRYKRLATSAPDPRYKPTGERFRDPTTGELVSVYADPDTGDRVYVRD